MLPETRLGRHIANQFVCCGTSPAANYEEACASESISDFVHKLSIVLKELLSRESGFGSLSKPICFLPSGSRIWKMNRKSFVTSSENRSLPPSRTSAVVRKILNLKFALCILHFAMIDLDFPRQFLSYQEDRFSKREPNPHLIIACVSAPQFT